MKEGNSKAAELEVTNKMEQQLIVDVYFNNAQSRPTYAQIRIHTIHLVASIAVK